MSGNQTDLTFFTNDKHQMLLDRFKSTLADTHLFDVLVGYFRSSGFYQLYFTALGVIQHQRDRDAEPKNRQPTL